MLPLSQLFLANAHFELFPAYLQLIVNIVYIYVVAPAGSIDISDSNKCTYVNIMTTTESMDSKSEYMSLQNPAGKIYLYTSDIA